MMTRSVYPLVALLLATLPRVTVAQNGNGHGITEDSRFTQALSLFEVWLDAKMDYEQIPGVSVALVHDQDLVWQAGYGYAHPERQIPATTSTLYSICSISKLFTSIGVMQLRDQGSLRLDDKVADHLPWFDLEQAYPEGPSVTVEGILTHSSGLPRESAHPYWTGPDYPFPTNDEIIEGLSEQETLYPARRYFQYSNLGMALAGQLIAQTSATAYDEYIKSNILEPLGMTNTYPEIPEQHKGELYATGYDRLTRDAKRAPAPFFKAHGIAPAAGFASTVEDLAKFLSWQMRLLEKGGTEVLNVNTLREMQRVHWVDPDFSTMWGLGFSVQRNDNSPVVGHGGSCPGFRSTVQLQPSKKMGGVVLINAQGTNPGTILTRMNETLGAAVERITSDEDGGKELVSDYAKYEGLYESSWGETAIIRWEDGLAAVSLPTGDPVEGMSKLRHEEGNVFRRVRDDGELGEAFIFEMGPNGQIARFSVHGNFSERVR